MYFDYFLPYAPSTWTENNTNRYKLSKLSGLLEYW